MYDNNDIIVLDREAIYNSDFYKSRYSDTQHAAKTVLGIVKEIIKFKSVVDVGCGVGAWLSVARSLGANDIYGVDGDWVDTNKIVIDLEEFGAVDLETLSLDHFKSKKYDVALSLEVIEHLSNKAGDNLVQVLCELSDIVLFSAAIPGQGGFGHINEQWLSFWKKRFDEKGYVLHDVVRPLIWSDIEIGRWYRQNCVLFIKKSKFITIDLSSEIPPCSIVDIVHPDIFIDYRYANFGVRHNLKLLWQSLKSSFKKRFRL